MGLEELIQNPLHTWADGDVIPYNYTMEHPDYVAKEAVWRTCRDAVAGQEAIKAAGTTYLPKLSGQTAKEYENFKKRAQYYNATGRTVQSYDGMIFRKDPLVTIKGSDGEAVELDKTEYYKKITNNGKSLSSLLQDVVEDIIVTNKVGILVDYPTMPTLTGELGMTLLQKEKIGYKPTLSVYPAESIKNWQFVYEGDKPTPVMYVLHEEIYEYTKNAIFPVPVDSYRILSLEPYTDASGYLKGRYKQTFLKENTIGTGRQRKKTLLVENTTYPMKDGDYLDFIPFFVITDKGIEFQKTTNPLIYDLAELNISHYMNSADWENELHMIATKTIYFPGWNKEVYGNPRFGGALAGPKDCTPMVIEATNKSGLADEMKNKEERMSVLGSEAISKQGRYVASAATAKISSKAEASILTTLAVSLSTAFSEILTFALAWDEHADLHVDVALNTDYYDEELTPEQIHMYMRAWQSGGISRSTYYNLLEKREVYPANWSEEREFKKIQEEMGSLFDLSQEKYLELLERISRLDGMLKSTESAGIASLVAETIPDLGIDPLTIDDGTGAPVVKEEGITSSAPVEQLEYV